MIKQGALGENVGLAWLPENIDTLNGTRSSARTGYFNPARGRANLDLLTHHYVSKIEFRGNAAVGVRVVSRATGTVALVRAKKEVIMAAGAVNTARTLQLSGVGPAPLLRSFGIKTVVDAPGVGANFQDHPWFSVILQCGSNALPGFSVKANRAHRRSQIRAQAQ